MAPSKRDDYKDLLGTLPDEEIAELAEVTVETVRRWRKDLDIDAPESEPEQAAEGDDEAAAPEGEDQPDEPAPAPKTAKKAAPAPAAEKPPRVVRAVGKAVIPKCPFLGGRTLKVRFRDIFTGDKAAWLWEHHRKLVEAYPPAS